MGKAFAELDWDVLRLAKTKAESAAKEESFAQARKPFSRPAAGAARFTWVSSAGRFQRARSAAGQRARARVRSVRLLRSRARLIAIGLTTIVVGSRASGATRLLLAL